MCPARGQGLVTTGPAKSRCEPQKGACPKLRAHPTPLAPQLMRGSGVLAVQADKAAWKSRERFSRQPLALYPSLFKAPEAQVSKLSPVSQSCKTPMPVKKRALHRASQPDHPRRGPGENPDWGRQGRGRCGSTEGLASQPKAPRAKLARAHTQGVSSAVPRRTWGVGGQYQSPGSPSVGRGG